MSEGDQEEDGPRGPRRPEGSDREDRKEREDSEDSDTEERRPRRSRHDDSPVESLNDFLGGHDQAELIEFVRMAARKNQMGITLHPLYVYL